MTIGNDLVNEGETIGAAEFKACGLELLDRLSAREVLRVTITKRGRPVAMLVPPEDAQDVVRQVHGFMRGSVAIPPGTDLAAPGMDEPFDAERILQYAGRNHVAAIRC